MLILSNSVAEFQSLPTASANIPEPAFTQQASTAWQERYGLSALSAPICNSQHNCPDLYLSGSGWIGHLPAPSPHLRLCTGRDFEAVSWGVSNIISSPVRCGGIPTESSSGKG